MCWGFCGWCLCGGGGRGLFGGRVGGLQGECFGVGRGLGLFVA